jgi:hypothetical protein
MSSTKTVVATSAAVVVGAGYLLYRSIPVLLTAVTKLGKNPFDEDLGQVIQEKGALPTKKSRPWASSRGSPPWWWVEPAGSATGRPWPCRELLWSPWWDAARRAVPRPCRESPTSCPRSRRRRPPKSILCRATLELWRRPTNCWRSSEGEMPATIT